MSTTIYHPVRTARQPVRTNPQPVRTEPVEVHAWAPGFDKLSPNGAE